MENVSTFSSSCRKLLTVVEKWMFKSANEYRINAMNKHERYAIVRPDICAAKFRQKSVPIPVWTFFRIPDRTWCRVHLWSAMTLMISEYLKGEIQEKLREHFFPGFSERTRAYFPSLCIVWAIECVSFILRDPLWLWRLAWFGLSKEVMTSYTVEAV